MVHEAPPLEYSGSAVGKGGAAAVGGHACEWHIIGVAVMSEECHNELCPDAPLVALPAVLQLPLLLLHC